MFIKRLFITLKRIGIGFLYLIGAGLVVSFMFWFLTRDNPIFDTILYIVMWIMVGIICLMFGGAILAYIIMYLDWQFFEPYREWKRRKKSESSTNR